MVRNELYEYRMRLVILRMLNREGYDIRKMSGEELIQFLYKFNVDFALLVLEDMLEWQDEDDWFELVSGNGK